jgi:hypothetical protein
MNNFRGPFYMILNPSHIAGGFVQAETERRELPIEML